MDLQGFIRSIMPGQSAQPQSQPPMAQFPVLGMSPEQRMQMYNRPQAGAPVAPQVPAQPAEQTNPNIYNFLMGLLRGGQNATGLH